MSFLRRSSSAGAALGCVLATALPSAASAEDLAGAAYSTCQMFALDRMPDRDDVRFPAYDEAGSVAPQGRRGDTYRVATFVERRRETGERRRERIYCDLRRLGPNHWELERILMGDGDRATLEREAATRFARAESAHRRQLLIEWVAQSFDRDDPHARSAAR